MDTINYERAELDTLRTQVSRQELVERIALAVPEDGSVEPLQGLYLFRRSSSIEPGVSMIKPSLCVIAQGCKDLFFGDSRYRYDPFHYLLVTIEMPAISRVIDASPKEPYLALRLELPATLVGSVMVETGYDTRSTHACERAIDVSPLDANLLDAVVRLIRLAESADDVQVLLPLIMREIIYRLLTGEQGKRLHHLAVLGGYTPDIAKAVQKIRQHFNQPLNIEQLAQELGMSVSGFHHHFKSVTAMSPLQFQKRLRLQEARRLMVGEDLDATSAAYRVGYNDVSHFNREYKSVFGVPPMRDVQQLRETSAFAG